MKKLQKYSELHLFIDESGIFTKTPTQDKEYRIGGILFWGEYDQHNKELMKYLADSHDRVYSSNDFENLHYHNKDSENKDPKLYWCQKNKFLSILKGYVDQWKSSNEDCDIEGFSIIHKEDIHPNASSLISEKEIDNRYLLMLRTLLEQLLFVDPRTNERLQSNATLYFHIASRTTVLHEDNPQMKRLLQSKIKNQGYQPKSDSRRNKKDDLLIPQILQDPELRGILREIQNRWSRSQAYEYRYDIKSICYDNRETPSLAGLYLADLWLGKKVYVATEELNSSELLFPEYRQWSYEPASMELTACKANIVNKNNSYFLDLLWNKPDIVANPLFADFKEEIATRLNEQQINALLEKVKTAIDSPEMANQFDHARKVLANIEEILLYRSQNAERIMRQLDWIHLAIANHTGNITEGNTVWEEFEKHFSRWENDTPENLLAFQTEMILRRAVNLIDAFDYEKAVPLLENIARKQKAVFEFFRDSDLFKFKSYRPILGYCISSLGQIQAFKARSEEDFKTACETLMSAMNYYNIEYNRQDMERTWVYIGHIACDMQWRSLPYGKILWNQVRQELNLPQFSDRNWYSSTMTNDNRYSLTLWIKGALVFGSGEEQSAILKAIQTSPYFLELTANVQNNPESIPHPWSLVFQSIAMMYARRYQETAIKKYFDLSLFHFDKAGSLMSVSQGVLFQFLMYISQLRKEVFIMESSTDHTENKGHLKKILNDIRALLVLYFGNQAWYENANGADGGFFGRLIDKSDTIENNAKKIVDAVTFNYW